MENTTAARERAVLVHVNFASSDSHEELAEFHELARSAGALPVAEISATRQAPDAKYFVGSGKAQEIADVVQQNAVELVLVNHSLSPAQERNLERLVCCRVLDRIGLILDIFAQRARTFEGKLQVELAQLQHLSTRLVRGWTHLERQKGGIGLRGPGETQLEVDRRLIRQRIASIEKRLLKVRRQRDQGRRARARALTPTVSLVGYTNAGKSTLFNRLTDASVHAADQLFATLDPTLRRIELPHFGPAILVDTVGFIRHLPHDLIESFRATLEETQLADLILHVTDASNEQRRMHEEQVNAVLTEIGAEQVPQLRVFNKLDKLPDKKSLLERDEAGKATRVWISAQSGDGLSLLQQAIAELLSQEVIELSLLLLPEAGKLRAELYQLNAVVEEKLDSQNRLWLQVRLPRADYNRLISKC